MKYMLNIGAGKYNEELLRVDKCIDWCVVHIDRCYSSGMYGKTIEEITKIITDKKQFDEIVVKNEHDKGKIYNYFCSCDVFDFLDTFPIKAFDKVICNRMFEHLEYCGGEVGRILEACNAISKYDATLEFIVPNAETLAKMILKEGELSDNDVMIINTEFCNGKFDPHASVWTPRLARKYIEQEATWEITKIIEKYPFAGRDIYMKVFCKKPQSLQHNKDLDDGNA